MEFNVRVEDNAEAGICSVRVCLYKPDDVYQVGWTDGNGEVTFVVYAESPGTMFITCTRPTELVGMGPPFDYQQYLPAQTTCEVVPGLGEGPQGEETGLPKELGFTSLNPNPALGDFTVQYGVPVKGRVKLLVHNVQGRVEAVVRDEELNPGYYREAFRKHKWSLPTGVHFLVLTQNDKKVARKLALVE